MLDIQQVNGYNHALHFYSLLSSQKRQIKFQDIHVKILFSAKSLQKQKWVGKDYRLAVQVMRYSGYFLRRMEQATNTGATILSEPENGFPARGYRAEDLEAHRWMFMQKEKTAV
jgi:uncharacterized glyoxalase superfamily protein PhnB